MFTYIVPVVVATAAVLILAAYAYLPHRSLFLLRLAAVRLGIVGALALVGCGENIQSDVGPILCTWDTGKGDYDCFATHDAGVSDAPVCFEATESSIPGDPACSCKPMVNGSPHFECCCP